MGSRIAGAILSGAVVAALGVGVSGGLVGKSSQPQPGPTVSVAPSTKLGDLQNVTVAGTHFSANAEIGTVECAPGALDEGSCDLGTLFYTNADNTGAFTLKRPVRRLIQINGSTVDCAAPGGCILGAGNVENFAESAGATITFDPQKKPIVPTVTVAPSTKLRDHQLVKVTGKGFTPGSQASVGECLATDSFACAYETNHYVNIEDNGTFTINNFPVERVFQTFGETGTLNVDCATAPKTCVISASAGGFGGGVPSSAPLTFDPKIPAAVPGLTVNPATGLADLQLVTIKGTGFLPGAPVTLAQCSGDGAACDSSSQTVSAGLQGQFTMTFAVRRKISIGTFNGVTPLDCATKVGACAFVAQTNGGTPTAPALLAFDPSKPAVVPSITVQPSTHLQDNTRVDVSVKGFAPYRSVVVVECSAEALVDHDLSYCDYTTQQVTTTPAGNGTPSVSFFVRRAISVPDGLVDCGAKAGACVLVAAPYTFYGYYGGGGGGVGGSSGGVPAAAPLGRSVRALPAPASARHASARAAASAPAPGVPGAASATLSFDKATQ